MQRACLVEPELEHSLLQLGVCNLLQLSILDTAPAVKKQGAKRFNDQVLIVNLSQAHHTVADLALASQDPLEGQEALAQQVVAQVVVGSRLVVDSFGSLGDAILESIEEEADSLALCHV